MAFLVWASNARAVPADSPAAASAPSGLDGGGDVADGPRTPRPRTVTGMPRDAASSPARRAANRLLGLPSTATSRRSRLVTKPFASKASRSSRARSSSRSGRRPSAHRSVGGITIVVRTAMATIIV
jgi:hypothetical protein